MLAQDLEADPAMPPPTWLDTQEDDEVVDSVVPESILWEHQAGESFWCRRVRRGHLNRWATDTWMIVVLSQAVVEAHVADEVRLPNSNTETVGVSDVSAHAPTAEAEVVAPVEEVTISPGLRDAFRNAGPPS